MYQHRNCQTNLNIDTRTSIFAQQHFFVERTLNKYLNIFEVMILIRAKNILTVDAFN